MKPVEMATQEPYVLSRLLGTEAWTDIIGF